MIASNKFFGEGGPIFNFIHNFLSFFSAGGIKKSKKPVSALTIDANKAARLALATGVITKGQENSEWIYE